MKIEKFKEEKKKKKSIIVFTVCCILLIAGVFLYQSFALFETRENFNFIEGNVEDPGDLYFAYYVDDVLTYEMPSKGSGYTMSSKSSCTNGVTISWDEEEWDAIVHYKNYKKENNSRVKCTLYFEEKKVPLTPADAVKDYILAKAPEGQIIEDDETPDHNLRYIGVNPNNYVSFNNELWRIVGVMNNIDDGTGKKESRIKLRRSESIGNYSWDVSAYKINIGMGINEWSQAQLMKLMNPGYESESLEGSFYWNKQSGTCHGGKINSSSYVPTISCDFTSNGLLEEVKVLIGEAVWNTGAAQPLNADGNEQSGYYAITTSKFYELERSDATGKICTSGTYCNDTVERTSTWTGIVGLITPSDYGYATSGGTTTSRTDCLNLNLYKYGESEGSDCKTNDWLLDSTSFQWTLTPMSRNNSSAWVWLIRSNGYVGVDTSSFGDTFGMYSVFPTVYLKSNIVISNGMGTKDSPFVLSEN